MTNSLEHFEALQRFLDVELEAGIGLVDNPHVNRIAALGVALEEMLEDLGYGERVVRNTKTLARALDELGVPVRFKNRGYTESHQILLAPNSRRAEELCYQLEELGIFVDVGGRIGVAEVTHRGMGLSEMEEIAGLIAEVYFKGVREEVKRRVKSFVENHK